MGNTVRLGILGLSKGNGHPYSWAAIFNGYDAKAMARCPYPAIAQYLSERTFPDDAIPGARVTHIWTQDEDASRGIAAASLIPTVVTHYEDLVGSVDGILLARDDADRHLEMSRAFLEAGMPIYVDKPLALSVREAEEMLELQRYDGQLFSCSALRFAADLQPAPHDREAIGTVRYVRGVTPKSWDHYGIHIIDGLLGALGPQGTIDGAWRWTSGGLTALHVTWESGLVATLTATGEIASPIALEYHGSRGSVRKQFADSFSAFKTALEVFVRELGGPRQGHRDELLDAIAVVERGRAPQ